ncbi:GNAT family N-acetyltransferase [Cellulomonas sp. ICMP 17802]|uniref:GNAT family N-acetyltransferase n=1 Tax=Cellulomonas sp. ICMP 17802 TaxID=3239199 RepID=UPI00351AB435
MSSEAPDDLRIEVCAPDHPDARATMERYAADLASRFRTGFDPARSHVAVDAELAPPAGLLLVARRGDRPVGCGALRFVDGETAEVKRVWVDPSARGRGLARSLLGELEAHARQRGVRTLRLETNETLHEAIALYRSAGYVEVDPFNDEPYAHHWFAKQLASDD